MTWHRIDENTYMDDTLVTCGEYQLFIDEMREQGMEFQPDHWRSHQFPQGKANEPILGIRYADAISFCWWLTMRINKDWGFTIPNYELATEYPVKTSYHISPLGYWTEWPRPEDESLLFTWINQDPISARNVDFPTILNSVLTHPLIKNIDRMNAYDHARNRPLDLGGPDIVPSQDRIPNRDETLKRSLDEAMKRTRDNRGKDKKKALKHDVVYYLDRYIDIFTLKERIAGLSPAFEGIRLLKFAKDPNQWSRMDFPRIERLSKPKP